MSLFCSIPRLNYRPPDVALLQYSGERRSKPSLVRLLLYLFKDDTYWKRSLCNTKLKAHAARQSQLRESAVNMATARSAGKNIGTDASTNLPFIPGDEVYVNGFLGILYYSRNRPSCR